MKLEKVTKQEKTSEKRWYDDACGTAMALELVGERWSLLIVRELMFRKILIPAKMRPHFLDQPHSQELLAKLRKGATVIDLISNE